MNSCESIWSIYCCNCSFATGPSSGRTKSISKISQLSLLKKRMSFLNAMTNPNEIALRKTSKSIFLVRLVWIDVFFMISYLRLGYTPTFSRKFPFPYSDWKSLIFYVIQPWDTDPFISRQSNWNLQRNTTNSKISFQVENLMNSQKILFPLLWGRGGWLITSTSNFEGVYFFYIV